jgi:hypothetical protein
LSWAERSGRLLVVLACAAGTAACGNAAGTQAGQEAASTTARPSDDMTQGLAEVEFGRLCAVGSANFAHEADLDADLDSRLSAAGFSHEQWKQWHDALADSPALVAQYAELSAAGCPAG